MVGFDSTGNGEIEEVPENPDEKIESRYDAHKNYVFAGDAGYYVAHIFRGDVVRQEHFRTLGQLSIALRDFSPCIYYETRINDKWYGEDLSLWEKHRLNKFFVESCAGFRELYPFEENYLNDLDLCRLSLFDKNKNKKKFYSMSSSRLRASPSSSYSFKVSSSDIFYRATPLRVQIHHRSPLLQSHRLF